MFHALSWSWMLPCWASSSWLLKYKPVHAYAGRALKFGSSITGAFQAHLEWYNPSQVSCYLVLRSVCGFVGQSTVPDSPLWFAVICHFRSPPCTAAAGITVHGRRCMTAAVGSHRHSDARQPHVPFLFLPQRWWKQRDKLRPRWAD